MEDLKQDLPLQTDRAKLGLFDTLNILVGIVVGTAIFRSPPLVFQNCSGPYGALAMWLLGGALSLVGALCYAELATSYRRDGGDYAFLRAAFGPCIGFLFAWAQLTVVLTGSLSAMAYAFADYGARLASLSGPSSDIELVKAATAIFVIVATTLFNLLGSTVGKQLQNGLTLAKVTGLALLVAAGLFVTLTRSTEPELVVTTPPVANWGLALVFVLYAFGGWNDAAFVAAEVEDAERNLPRALWIGLGCVTLIYVTINVIYLRVLGVHGVNASYTPAAEVLQAVVGDWGAAAISILVMVSAWGAIQGMIFTGARVYASVGVDHRSLRWLALWNHVRRVPVRALIAQAIVSTVFIAIVGTAHGRSWVDRSLQSLSLPQVPWARYPSGFETLVAGSAPVFWIFFLATGCSLFVLRWRFPEIRRPFAVPFYPFTPLLFCTMCIYMLQASVRYAQGLALVAMLPLLVGLVVYFSFEFPRRSARTRTMSTR